jgi:hypothetical protein
MRPAPKSGPTSSDAWNDSFTELASDLSNIASEWNNKLIPIIQGLPNGSKDTNVNVFIHGLDGKNLWVDLSLTVGSEDLTFFNSAKNRPCTVEEALRSLYGYVDEQIDQTRLDLSTGGGTGGLTVDQKSRIGANIFDPTQISGSSSLDGKSERNRLNINQLAYDLYGPGYTLGNDGDPDLSNTVMHMVDALLTLHGGNWPDDITLNHNDITVIQSNVGSSHPGNDEYSGTPTNCVNDLDYIRTKIKELKGTSGWLTTLPVLYTGGADSLYDLLANTHGSSPKTASNPWGYHYDDIDELGDVLDALQSFLGQAGHESAATDYPNEYFISDGQTVVQAIGTLDEVAYTASGIVSGHTTSLSTHETYFDNLVTFVGQADHSDTTPPYSSTHIITNGSALNEAISALDADLYSTNGYVATLSGQRAALQTFVGQLTSTDITPDYASATIIVQGSSLVEAIGALDAAAVSVSGIAAGGLPIDGSLPMEGNLDMDGHHILNVENLFVQTIQVADDVDVQQTLTLSGKNAGYLLTTNADGEVIDASYMGGSVFLDPDNGYVGVGTETPVTRLDVNGVVTSKGLQTSGTNSLQGTTTIAGSLTLDALEVIGSLIAEDGTFTGDLLVSAIECNTIIDHGSLTVASGIVASNISCTSLEAGSATIDGLSVSSDISVGHNLTVVGDVVSSGLSISSDALFCGDVTISGSLNVGGITYQDIQAEGDMFVEGNLGVDGGLGIYTFTAGESLSQYDVVYAYCEGGTTARVKKATASAMATARVFGVVVDGNTVNNPVTIVMTGMYKMNFGGTTPGVEDFGKPVYLSETAGQVTLTSPGTGTVLLRVGYLMGYGAATNHVSIHIGDTFQQ